MLNSAAATVRDQSVDELTRSALRALCLCGVLMSWAWWMVAVTFRPDFAVDWSQGLPTLPPVVLLVACLIPLLAGRLPVHLRSALFVAGLAFTCAMALLWSGNTLWLYYPSLCVVVAGLLIGSRASVFTASGLTVAALLERGQASRTGAGLLAPVGLLWLAAAVSWLSSRNLYAALQWALHGQERNAELLAQLRARQGELNRTLVALTEASRRLERTNAELAIARERAEEARALKEHFVANVSHELRTPLNLVMGFSEMMYLQPESYEGVGWTAELQGDIGQLYRASCHLQSLVNDILDLSRIDAARLPMFRELTDIRSVIVDATQTVAPLLKQRGLTCTTHLADGLPPLLVDRTRIRQVMLNLLNNAVRFTDTGGITVRLVQTEDTAVVSVLDTGVGIPKDRLETIFERFQQLDDGPRRRGGAGLGLALSRQFVELHGGRMWVESEPGSGSTFSFSLPLPGATPQTTPLLHQPGAKVAGADMPLVVVDPDPAVADMLSRYLGDRRICWARDVADAEALLDAEHPLAVIVNQPPCAPDCSWAGDIGPVSQQYNVPVFRCSMPSSSWLGRTVGLDDCLTKPVSRESLHATLERWSVGPGTVLVVDDNPGFGALARRILRASSLVQSVMIAHCGSEGIRMAREAKPQIVLLDLLLPDMDGFAVLEALRQDSTLGATRVIAVTASSFPEEALQRGGCFSLSLARGVPTGACIEMLNQALGLVHPDYGRTGRSPST